MAELFTEEDVRKIKDCIVNPSTRLPKRDGENFPTWAARAILSALAEDGRLNGTAGFELASLGGRHPYTLWLHRCGHVEGWPVTWKPVGGGCDACESGSDDPADWQPLYRSTRPAESGGALPSDAPALAVEGYVWSVRRDGVTFPIISEAEARAWAERDQTVELIRRAVGPWEPVPDPVSVLEEETRSEQ